MVAEGFAVARCLEANFALARSLGTSGAAVGRAWPDRMDRPDRRERAGRSD
ncbi:MAG TPA: hypothetical protein VFQ44_22915 [Streptosporangiaceae bacterium]|nr:hypothetical protein [Streptosporangiaceae bacterium]